MSSRLRTAPLTGVECMPSRRVQSQRASLGASRASAGPASPRECCPRSSPVVRKPLREALRHGSQMTPELDIRHRCLV